MTSLFKLDRENKVILHPHIIQLCGEFQVLSQQELLYVILRTDYNSIFSQFTEDERIRRSSYHSFGDYIDLESKPKIRAAVSAYNSLQYSPKQEQARVYQNKINQLLEDLMTETSAKAIRENMDATEKLRAGIRELEQEIIEAYQEENVRLVGGGERSFLEKCLANKALYTSVTKKK